MPPRAGNGSPATAAAGSTEWQSESPQIERRIPNDETAAKADRTATGGVFCCGDLQAPLAYSHCHSVDPPLLMAGCRSLLAGGILYAIMRLRVRPGFRIFIGATPPHRRTIAARGQWRGELAQQTVPSSIRALMVAATPLWMILIDWLRPAGKRPHFLTRWSLRRSRESQRS